MKLVISPPVADARLAKIRAAAGPMLVVNTRDEDHAAAEIVDADALFGYLTPRLLKAAAKLRWAQSPTASMEKYLYPDLVASKVIVTNMRGIFSDVIADHVFGYILMFAKNFHIYLRQQMQAKWRMLGRPDNELPGYGGPGEVHPSDCTAITLADCTLAVIGLGGIGAETARRGLAFGMRVFGVDPQPAACGFALAGRDASAKPQAAIFRPDQLHEVLPQADFVVIAAPHTPETFKLFNRQRIRQMKKTAYLINVGRGVIVDLADLTAALQAGEIAGAGLDVFEVEPLPSEHPMWRMENVIITPHCAAASPRVPERHLATLLENIRRFVAGQPLMNVVDKNTWC
ncbi:MAG: D-2-hydroxyacid dehydrogenase [Planctomycetes bacterium]|nr:D-2-hydroxyacid dehydrogenase [Planctomycetota bacterium]